MSRIVLHHPSPLWDGIARVYVEIGRALATRGVMVAVACPGASAVASACAGLDVLPYEDRDAWFSDARRLGGLLREYGADAVMVANEFDHLQAAVAVRHSGRGVVLRRTMAGAATRLTFRTWLAVRLAPTWFVHGSAADARAAEPVTKLRGRIVAELAVDPLQFERVIAAPNPIGTSTIAVVTDAGAQRATAAALSSIAAMRRRGHPIHTLLFGTPHDVNELRVHATAIGLGDDLVLVGDPIDRAPLLASADIVWVTADRDDGGLAVLDAMSLGCPVVATRGTIGERYVKHGETGLLADRDDALASAALVTLLRSDPAQMTRLRDAAMLEVRARRGLSSAADAIMGALDDASVPRAAA